MTNAWTEFELDDELRAHLGKLESVLLRHRPLVVAYSGGVDSGLLAYVAHKVLGDDVVCAIGISPSLAGAEERDAIAFLETHGIPLLRVRTHEGEDERYRANHPDRCFYCKDDLFVRIGETPALGAFEHVAYGANLDDRSDHRPGAEAALRHHVIAPLAQAAFTKDLVRRTARTLGLELWDKPAAPCLASRVPYYAEVTPEKLAQIERAEAVLKELGFRDCRVRHHGDTARIEVPEPEHTKVEKVWSIIVAGVTAAGFRDAILEADGLRSGRLNDVLRDG